MRGNQPRFYVISSLTGTRLGGIAAPHVYTAAHEPMVRGRARIRRSAIAKWRRMNNMVELPTELMLKEKWELLYGD